MLASVLLSRVKSKLLQARRIEQSGFTPSRSTADRIFTLNALIQMRQEFNQPLWIAYVDLKSAFDSIDRQSLCLLLQSLGLPAKIVNLTKALYTDTCNCVLADRITSDWFQVDCSLWCETRMQNNCRPVCSIHELVNRAHHTQRLLWLYP